MKELADVAERPGGQQTRKADSGSRGIMNKNMYLQRIGSVVLMGITAVFFANIQLLAQTKDYKPGQKIEYRSSGYPETWEEAAFIKATPDGSQPIIRQLPNEFSKDGFQRAASWADIRPLRAVKKVIANDEPKAKQTEIDPQTSDTEKDFGTGLMTQSEVLTFLETKLSDKPFQNPRREQIKNELAEMVKARGLAFRFSSSDTVFYSKLGKYGATSDIVFPLRDNYGPPTKQSSLMGAWNLGKTGAAVDYVRNNRVYRQGEIGVANVGTLTMNVDGTYLWKSVTAQSTGGQWRKATKGEMKSQGGDGIVLLKAKSGYDWIVTKNRATELKGEWIYISELGTRQINEYGSRGGKK